MKNMSVLITSTFPCGPFFPGFRNSDSMASSKPSTRCLVGHVLVPNTEGVPAICLARVPTIKGVPCDDCNNYIPQKRFGAWYTCWSIQVHLKLLIASCARPLKTWELFRFECRFTVVQHNRSSQMVNTCHGPGSRQWSQQCINRSEPLRHSSVSPLSCLLFFVGVSGLSTIQSLKKTSHQHLRQISGVSSFGFGGTNGRCDIWGAARPGLRDRSFSAPPDSHLSWLSGLVTISVGKFWKPKWIKSIPSARTIDPWDSTRMIFEEMQIESTKKTKKRSIFLFFYSGFFWEKVSFNSHLGYHVFQWGPVTLGKIDYLTGEPLSRRLAALHRRAPLLGSQRRRASPFATVRHRSHWQRGEREKPMSFEMSLHDMMCPGWCEQMLELNITYEQK